MNTFEDAIKYTNRLVSENGGRELTPADRSILKAAWHKITFKAIAEETEYTAEQLRTYIGVRLWSKVTDAFGEVIKKKNFREVVEKRLNNPSLRGKAVRASVPVLNNVGFPFTRGDQPPGVSAFIGRSPELAMLKESCNISRCVAITGPVGIGKSSLVARFVEESINTNSQVFECCVWKGIHYHPPIGSLLTELLLNLGVDVPEEISDAQKLTSMLMDQLKARRCLLILDACEAIISETSIDYFSGYGLFFRRFIEEQHRGCLILTSQEPLPNLNLLENKGHSVRSMNLTGLGEDALTLLKQQKVLDRDRWGELIQKYRGNPLALKMVAEKIKEYFGGSVATYLKYNSTWVLDPFDNILTGQLSRLPAINQQILFYLAKQQRQNESTSLEELQQGIQVDSISQTIDALDQLEALFLVEKNIQEGQQLSLTLPPIVLKFMLNAQGHNF